MTDTDDPDEAARRAERVLQEAEEERRRVLAAERVRDLEIARREREALDEEDK